MWVVYEETGGGGLIQILTTKVGLCASQWETSYPG